jgi:hypothetical protein
MLYTDREFIGQTVNLDGNRFVNCRFQDCQLVFYAYEPVSFDRCVFDECDWVFEGAADIMLSFLTALYHGLGKSGQDLVELIFDSVRNGSFVATTPTRAIA